ncbi:hypothetical protein AB0L40_04285 [Patulibacter sp. NPDC049589]|uniref:hypothetical protein n=1 Tax=Patulibacter sp. NPDC049589 TaxID=3154731 RepID=UPI0034495F1B
MSLGQATLSPTVDRVPQARTTRAAALTLVALAAGITGCGSNDKVDSLSDAKEVALAQAKKTCEGSPKARIVTCTQRTDEWDCSYLRDGPNDGGGTIIVKRDGSTAVLSTLCT